ncbi:MAG: YcxB family protein [Pseudomonadota bacterium]
MAEELTVSGTLTEQDMTKLIKVSRTSTVGPTALYYAGVTAPAISAAMAVVTRAALTNAHFLDYWINFWSSIMAALTGISWYLIFVRWSDRRKAGRASDLEGETKLSAGDNGLILKRDQVETRIGWGAISRIQSTRKHTVVFVTHQSPIVIPHNWFADRETQSSFLDALQKGAA